MTKIPVRPPQAKNPTTVEEGAADSAAAEALRALGLSNPGTVPDETTAIADLLLYALTPVGGARPDQGIVLGVAAELDSLAMFVEGPLGVALEMMARRIRTAVTLARRMSQPPPPEAG